jgi:hypothetical protein
MNNACGENGGGGGGNGGGGGQNGGSSGGGQVLGANMTVASLSGGGGLGAAFATLPNTGLHEGVNNWLVISILTVAASIGYWSKVIAPRLNKI